MTRVPCTWWDSTEGNSLETSGTYRRLHRDDGSVVQVKHFPELLHRLQTSTCISLNKHFAANDHAGGQAHYYSRTGTSNKDKSSFTGPGLFVLMSQCGNNNGLALQHGGFCTTWSLVAKRTIVRNFKIIYHNEKQPWNQDGFPEVHRPGYAWIHLQWETVVTKFDPLMLGLILRLESLATRTW